MNYKLSARVMEGSQIVGYKLLDEEGNETRIKKETVENLAEEGLIVNCTVIEDNGKKYLKGLGISISELPVIDLKQNESSKIASEGKKLRLVKRVLDKGKGLTGYIAESDDNQEYRLSLEETWVLCRKGVILNAKAQLSENTKLLVGIDSELRLLPTVE